MFRYSTLYINIVSFTITIIIFFSLNLIVSNYKYFIQKSSLKAGFKVENQVEELSRDTNEIQANTEAGQDIAKEKEQTESTKKEQEKNTEENEWGLEIPTINLKAPIKEGTTREIIGEYIGHFEETSTYDGNVGLAAHNRGYKNNYFENLKKLKEGDKIIYKYKNQKREYVVTKSYIIRDTDWTMLEETEKNTITLITCVENQPEYRRCIQGEEI